MFILLKNIYTMYMVYTSRFSYKCRKLFPVSRNLTFSEMLQSSKLDTLLMLLKVLLFIASVFKNLV